MNGRTGLPEMPGHLRMLRSFAMFVGGIFALVTIFTLLLLFFAPGPIRIEDRAVAPSEFRGLGIGIIVASALIAIAMTAASIGIYRRREWFRGVLLGLAVCIVAGGAAVNLSQGSVGLAAATLVLGTPAVIVVWAYLYRSSSIQDYLEE